MDAKNAVYLEWIRILTEILSKIEITRQNGDSLSSVNGFDELHKLTKTAREYHQTIFLIGNGASASMASHIAADLCKNGHLSTEVFTDLSLITAVANDLGAEHIYATPLERRARPGDMLVAISSSGRSPNILKAIDVTRKLNMSVVTFSAMSHDNPLRKLGDLNFYVPAPTYGQAESAHAALLHFWVDCVAGAFPNDKKNQLCGHA